MHAYPSKSDAILTLKLFATVRKADDFLISLSLEAQRYGENGRGGGVCDKYF